MASIPPRHRLQIAANPEALPSEAESYTYTPLENSREIRLLKNFRMGVAVYALEGELEFRQELSCEVVTINVDMSDDVPYVALSYTWGSALPEAPASSDTEESTQSEYWIYCNGARLDVSENLHCYLRHANFDLPIWIDAICINQQISAERNAQIMIMSEIYARAFAVIV